MSVAGNEHLTQPTATLINLPHFFSTLDLYTSWKKNQYIHFEVPENSESNAIPPQAGLEHERGLRGVACIKISKTSLIMYGRWAVFDNLREFSPRFRRGVENRSANTNFKCSNIITLGTGAGPGSGGYNVIDMQSSSEISMRDILISYTLKQSFIVY